MKGWDILIKKTLLFASLVIFLFIMTTGIAVGMDATQNDVCLTCHGGPVNTPINGKDVATYFFTGPWSAESNFSDLHSIRLNKYHTFSCFKCHPDTFFSASTCNCHSGKMPVHVHSEENVTYRTNYTYLDHNDATLYNISTPRTNTDCIYCHQQSKTTGSGTVIANHDIPSRHIVQFPDATCQQCHTNILTNEHTGATKTDAQGKEITCMTCHNNDPYKSKIPVYQPYRLRVIDTSYKYYNNTIFYDEYTIPNKQIKGFKLNLKTNKPVVITVQGYYDGKWNTTPIFTTPTINPVFLYTNTITTAFTNSIVQITPMDKIRIGVSGFDSDPADYNKQIIEVQLDNWLFANPDAPITCTTCHENAVHLPKHDTSFDASCASCHNPNLQTEHLNRGKTCDNCHKGQTIINASDVKSAIAWQQVSCSDCHTGGHGVTLVSGIPVEIPVYPSLVWSKPISVKLFTGENWLTTEALNNNAKVLTAERTNQLSGYSVWTWYRDNLQKLGWTVTSGEPQAGSNYYNVTFNKGTKNATLWVYGGSDHAAGPVLATGYKVELVYWDKPVIPPAPVTKPIPQLPNTVLVATSTPMANLPLTALPATLGDLTIEFWAKPVVTNGLVYRTTNPLDNYNNLGMYLPWKPDYTTYKSIYNDIGVNRDSTHLEDSWLSQWAHYAYVKKGSDTKVYRNGIVIGYATNTGIYNKLNQSLNLGEFWNQGELDDFRIWGVARTEQEIRDNKDKELTGNESGLLGYWKMNEISGNVLLDSTPNHNNGVLQGGNYRQVTMGYLDLPGEGATLKGSVVTAGWFASEFGLDKVEILVDGVPVGKAIYGDKRQDVYDYWGTVYPTCLNSGYHYYLDTTKLSNGPHVISARSTDINGVQTISGNIRNVTVAN